MSARIELTPMQRAFVGFYLADPYHNGSEAARRAGCNPKSAAVSASKWLRLDKVKKAIEAEMAEREKRTRVDADYIVTAAKDIAEKCMEREPVLEREGNKIVQASEKMACDCGDPNCKGTRTVGLWKFDSAGATAALKLLASHVRGFHAPRETELSAKEGAPLTVQIVTYKPGKPTPATGGAKK